MLVALVHVVAGSIQILVCDEPTYITCPENAIGSGLVSRVSKVKGRCVCWETLALNYAVILYEMLKFFCPKIIEVSLFLINIKKNMYIFDYII